MDIFLYPRKPQISIVLNQLKKLQHTLTLLKDNLKFYVEWLSTK